MNDTAKIRKFKKSAFKNDHMLATMLLIRHAETAWNREKISRGVYDVPQNENGRTQARHLAKALASRKITIATAAHSPGPERRHRSPLSLTASRRRFTRA